MKYKNLKVLLVEDDPICRKAETNLLKKMGFIAETAKTAQEAFELVNNLHVDLLEKQYDFIFMDIGLPDINGDFVSDMIRKTEEWSKPIPIIAVTAHDTEEDKQRFIQKGISDVIVKPLTTKKLEMALKKYI